MTADLDLVETRPLDADAWRQLAEKRAAEGRIADAIDALARAHHVCPPRSGQTLLEISKSAEALAVHPQSVSLQLRLARSCAHAGFLDRAIVHAEAATQHDFDNPDAQRELAELYWKRGRHDEGLDALYRVLWMKRDDVMTALLLAERLVELNRVRSAMAIARRIADRLPPTGEAELRIGRLLRRCGAAEAALWRLEKAVVLIPESPYAHYELALAYIEAERPAAAIDELIETARLRPEWGDPMRRLSAIYRQLGMTEEANKIDQHLQPQPITLDLDELVSVEDEEFSEETDLSGRLRLMPVAELLQFLAHRNLTGVLRVSSERGSGSIEIFRGAVVSAELQGIERLVRDADAEQHFLHCQTVIGEMINWKDGQIDFVSGASYEQEPTIRFDVPHLLLETIRRMDEANA